MNSEEKKELRKKMKKILSCFHENLSESEKKSLAKNLCEKITALDEYKNAKIILAYIPDKNEADCTPVILHALQNGKKVAVPKVDAASLKKGESNMDFYFLEKDTPLEAQLEVGTYGIREPKAGLEKFSWGVVGQKASYTCPAERVAEDREAGWSEGDRERPDRGKTCEASFERVSVKAVPEPFPFVLVPGVAFTCGGKRLGHGKGFYDIYIEEMRKSGANPFLCGVALPCQILPEIPDEAHDILMDKVIF